MQSDGMGLDAIMHAVAAPRHGNGETECWLEWVLGSNVGLVWRGRRVEGQGGRGKGEGTVVGSAVLDGYSGHPHVVSAKRRGGLYKVAGVRWLTPLLRLPCHPTRLLRE
jgi:hypothetical protein